MAELFDEIMLFIFKEHNFDLASLIFKYNDENRDWSSNLYIAKNCVGDYFVYLNLPENVLSEVNSDAQIEIAALIKHGSEDFENIIGEGLKIDSSFEKKATLIIFCEYEKENENNVKNQSILIEEDPYFFKKQALLIADNEVSIISESFDENRDNYVEFIQGLISNTDRFIEFSNRQKDELSNNIVEYSFVAKLYEKLPFLDLKVTESNQEVLQLKIDKQLTEEQLAECEKLLQLDMKNLDDWFNEIIKDESDD